MRHTKTPDESGWYWVGTNPSQADGWQIAYWDADADVPTLYTYSPELLVLKDVVAPACSRWRECDDYPPHKWIDRDCEGTWSGPECWVGPMNCPGGPFGCDIIEASEELHEKARASKGVIVIHHRDFTHCNDTGHRGTTTTTAIRPRPRAYDEPIEDAAHELADALREIHDFAEETALTRHRERSHAAFTRAAELLKRIGK